MKPNIAIIGYGRFGKLLAKMLKPYGRVHIISPKRERGVKQIPVKGLSEMDWVIPAVPISSLEAVLKEISPQLKPGAIVMDVCSVKVLPCRWLKKNLRRDIQIIGAHPLFGPDSARHGLRGLVLVLCPLRISRADYQVIVKIFKALELNVIKTTPEKHDREAAKSLALVHFIGRGLDKLHLRPQAVSTMGFDRLLKVNETVTNDTWQLFRDMHRFNPYAKAERRSMIKALTELDKML